MSSPPFLIRLSSAFRSRWDQLDSQTARRAVWLLPLLFGLMALALGQDDNWDLRNYHLYTPFALTNGKIGLDLAPGQWQSYFNPTLDLVYYGLIKALPAPLAGLAMGVLHGLNVLLAWAIARRLLAHQPHTTATRTPMLLALAGCMGCAFFSQLGNSMGDNLTALCVLGSLLLVLRHQAAIAAAAGRGLALALLAGLVMGAGTGLKLTNATYALAACLALFAFRGGVWRGVLRALAFGVGVLAAIGVTAGHWFWRMWESFGNPLFPQFNHLFKGPLAAPIGVGDTHWLPQGLAEHLLWPFIFSIHPERVIEIKIQLLLWPVLYVAFALSGITTLRDALARRPSATPPSPTGGRFLLVFFVLAYLGWQLLFSIYRYLVPLELLAPLVLWLLAHRLLAPRAARHAAGWTVLLAVLLALPTPHWGRARWAAEAFRVQAPALDTPAQSLVLTTQAPVGWYTAGLPAGLAVVSIDSGFPQSAAYGERVAAMVAARGGPLYTLLTSSRQDPRERPRAERQVQDAEADARLRTTAAATLSRYGLRLDPAAECPVYPAYIGRNYLPYQFCPVFRRQEPAAAGLP